MIEVVDDGVGFNVKEVSKKKDVGIGLISLHQRIAALNGKLLIKSTEKKGTEIGISVPF